MFITSLTLSQHALLPGPPAPNQRRPLRQHSCQRALKTSVAFVYEMTMLLQVPMPITVQPTVNVQHVSALFSEVQTAGFEL